MQSFRPNWTPCNVANPYTLLKAATFIEAVHAGISPAALKQNVVAILVPRHIERSLNDSASMTSALKVPMCNHIFDETVFPPLA